MNRYAPPASDRENPAPSFQVGKAGWLAAGATFVQLATIVVGYPQITELFGTNPVAVFFVDIEAATSLFLVLGTLLLLSRFPSSMLLFTAALVTALLGFRNYSVLLPSVSFAASIVCLAASTRVFFKGGRRQPVGREA
jgi:hypothetical protein